LNSQVRIARPIVNTQIAREFGMALDFSSYANVIVIARQQKNEEKIPDFWRRVHPRQNSGLYLPSKGGLYQ
jgi:hypothetical protein